MEMKNLEAAPRQLNLVLDTVKLRGLNVVARGMAIMLLAGLLLEAADLRDGEDGDESI